MKAPKCRVCQSEHWANEPHRFAGEAKAPADRHVTARPRNVTPPPRNVTCVECDRLRARLIEVEAELKQIKTASARRVKAYRDRRKKS